MIARSFASVTIWLMTMGMIFYLLSLDWLMATVITPMLLYGTFAAFSLIWMDEVDFGRGRFYRTQQSRRADSEEREAEAEVDEEKRKRDRLDAVLRDLSDEDLLRLRERLSDGSINDEVLYERLVGEDGEFVTSRR